METTLHNFFYPDSILIAGASSKKSSIGYELTATILKYGYTGKILLVNPSSDEILGIKCYKTVADIPGSPDMAIVLVPKQFAEETIDACIIKGIKSFILITAGFRETGSEGAAAEKRIFEKIRKAGGRMVGPNCMGVINTLPATMLNATFVAEHPETGKSAFLSQSGALGAAVLNSLRETGIRFAHFISVGNKADVSENDLLKYWVEDDNISVITFYLESFSDGTEFIDIVSGRMDKPLIILKAGKTKGGMKAASSHTGALGSSDRSVQAIIDQFGLIRAENLNDLFNTAKGFENYPLPAGKKVAVVTNAGGPAIITVDMIEKCGLELSPLSDNTKSELRKFVHPEGSVNNPVDLLPGGTADVYQNAVETLLKDDSVDAVFVIFVEPVMVKAIPVVSRIDCIKSNKPVMTVVMPLPEFWQDYKKEFPNAKPVFRNPEDPAVVVKNMLKFANRKTADQRLTRSAVDKTEILKNASDFLNPEQVAKISEMYNFPVVQNRLLNYDELRIIKTGFPYVLKAGGKGIVHKTELKGVVLDIKTPEELLKAADEMRDAVEQSGQAVEYFILQPYLKTKFELLVGGFRDPDFGPMVMFGTGGKYVEYYEDVCLRSAFLTEDDVEDMINNTIAGKLIKGVRSEQGIDLTKVKNTILSVARLMLDFSEVSEIDLNPVIVSEDNRISAVDIRIKLH